MARATLSLLVYTIVFAAAIGPSTVSALARVSQSQPQTSAAQDGFPETPGKTALLKVCGNCHGAETVIQSFRTHQEWSDVIDQMARFGAEASDQEFEQILTYLVKHFSPIKINNATAKDRIDAGRFRRHRQDRRRLS